MFDFRTIRWAAILGTGILALTGCADIQSLTSIPDTGAQTPPPPSGSIVGYITAIQGSNGFVEHLGGTVSASVNQPIFQGDRFFTRAATGMQISLNSGAILDVQENTDPTIVQEIQCLFIRLFQSGEIYVSGSNVCIESAPNAVIQHSAVDYKVLFPPGGRPKVLRVLVLSGQAQSLRPPGTIINAGFQLDLQNGRPLGFPVPASPLELRRIRAWTDFGRLTRLPQRPGIRQPSGPPGPTTVQ
jgi:hypothetical protein